MKGFGITGKKGLDFLLIGLSTLTSLAALGFFLYTQILYERPPTDTKKSREALEAQMLSSSHFEMFKIEKIIANLPSSSASLRFCEVVPYLVVFEKETLALLEKNIPVIRDFFLEEIGRFSPEELNTVSGKLLMQNRVKERVNSLVNNTSGIKEIIFETFVIQ